MTNKFNKIADLIRAQYAQYINNHAQYINTGNDDRLKAYSTDTRYSQYINGKISREKCVEYALQRSEKKYNKELAKELEKLEKMENAPKVNQITIDVDWRRNATWGHNPFATVRVWTDNGYFESTGYASGCGYDKRSAAVGEALNKIYPVIAALCEVKENNITEERTKSNECITYGAGYGAIPYFEGGVGIDCHIKMLEMCGLKKTHEHGTKTTDYYCFER